MKDRLIEVLKVVHNLIVGTSLVTILIVGIPIWVPIYIIFGFNAAEVYQELIDKYLYDGRS